MKNRRLDLAAALLMAGALTPHAGYSYTATATVNFAFGTTGTSPAWLSAGANTLPSLSDSTYFSTLAGYNSTSYFNSAFASASQCAALMAPGNTLTGTRKYGCRYVSSYYGGPAFVATPPDSPGPGAQAAGTLTVTDTTITGTLTILPTTDAPTGSTFAISPTGARISSSVGDGTSAFNLRFADGSPFGNVWYGVTPTATLAVSLSGTFTASSWQITGGHVRFVDPGFQCQQGGFGASIDATAGILCTESPAAGGHQHDGGHLSWGWDTDGAGTGPLTMSEIEVRDSTGTTILDTLSGVLANLTLDVAGNITTVSAETRRALGSFGAGCPTHIRWSGTAITCGQLFTTDLVITGRVDLPPVVNGRMTGGGRLANSAASHGMVLNCNAAAGPSNLEVNWGGNRFHLEALTSAACADDPAIAPDSPAAGFDTHRGAGTGRYNGQPGATAEWVFTDAGEPGRNDVANIVIRNAANEIVLAVNGTLRNGNHQAHRQ